MAAKKRENERSQWVEGALSHFWVQYILIAPPKFNGGRLRCNGRAKDKNDRIKEYDKRNE